MSCLHVRGSIFAAGYGIFKLKVPCISLHQHSTPMTSNIVYCIPYCRRSQVVDLYVLLRRLHIH